MPLEYNPFVAQRREFKLKLLNLIKSHPDMEKKQVVALFSLQTGLRRARVLEYWQELIEAGVVEDGGWDSAKRSVERNGAPLERSDDGRFRALADSEKHRDLEQESTAEDTGKQDNSGEQAISEADN